MNCRRSDTLLLSREAVSKRLPAARRRQGNRKSSVSRRWSLCAAGRTWQCVRPTAQRENLSPTARSRGKCRLYVVTLCVNAELASSAYRDDARSALYVERPSLFLLDHGIRRQRGRACRREPVVRHLFERIRECDKARLAERAPRERHPRGSVLGIEAGGEVRLRRHRHVLEC